MASTLLFLVLAGGAFYLLILRPQRQRQRQQQEMQTSLYPGVEVMTTAGVFGTVAAVTDDQVSIEIHPGVFMRVVPAAIARVIEPPEQPAIEPPVD